ncbi:MAG: tetratricopeptide repeat protein [Pseudomonadota bacterium]|nr:tetratricopeptide repeat protein [Pseudomonadota bacterium]
MSGPRTAANNTGWSLRIIAVGLLAGLAAGCGGQPQTVMTVPSSPPSGANITAAAAAAAEVASDTSRDHDTVTSAGHYLAARQALYFNDVSQSATFFLETLEAEADSVPLLRQAFLTQYYYGDIERAAALGRQLERLDVVVPLGGEPGTALAIKKEDWAAALILADRISEDGTSLVLAGIIRGWSLVASGRGDAGISALLEAGRLAVNPDGGMPPYFRLQAALMAEHLGLTAEAEQRVNGLDTTLRGAHLLLQLAALHARLGNWQDVDRIISTRLSGQFNHPLVRAALERQADTLPGVHRMIADAVVAMALDERDGETSQSIAARLRFSLFIDPDNQFTRLLMAQQMADFDQNDAALDTLARIPSDGVYGQLARLTEASVIEDQGDAEIAIETMRRVVEMDPRNASLHQRLGDMHRRHRQFRLSRNAYMAALDLGLDSGDLHRSLGVSLERLGETRAAETHLLRAIEIDPSDAYALNYLGYWWADEGRNLDEAIAMIERAVSQRPDSGFFVDSLGWVHFRLGDPVTAVGYLERATALEPSDPEITGHLGDVYWVLGRRDEARFKWRLALSLSTDEAEQKMLSDRLAKGLPPSEIPRSD